MCSFRVVNFTGMTSAIRSLEGGLLGIAAISNVGVFHKYSLRGDTKTPSELYARLCHAFLVLIALGLLH